MARLCPSGLSDGRIRESGGRAPVPAGHRLGSWEESPLLRSPSDARDHERRGRHRRSVDVVARLDRDPLRRCALIERTPIVAFARAPVPGEVKTRLCGAVGADGAAVLAGALEGALAGGGRHPPPWRPPWLEEVGAGDIGHLDAGTPLATDGSPWSQLAQRPQRRTRIGRAPGSTSGAGPSGRCCTRWCRSTGRRSSSTPRSRAVDRTVSSFVTFAFHHSIK